MSSPSISISTSGLYSVGYSGAPTYSDEICQSKRQCIARHLSRLWKKLPSRDRIKCALDRLGRIKAKAHKKWNLVNRFKGGLQDVWYLGQNVKHLSISLIQNEFFNNIFKTASNTDSAVSSTGYRGKYSADLRFALDRFRYGLKWVQLFSVASIPFTVWGIGRKGVAVVRGDSSRFDNALGIINDVGGIMQNVSGFAGGLAGLGLVSAATVAFAGPLGVVGSVLGLSGQIVTVRGLWQTFWFSREFNKVCQLEKDGSIADDNFNRALDFLCRQNLSTKKARSRHNYLLGKHFNFDGRKLNDRFNEIRNKPDSLSSYDKAKFIKTLRWRMITKQCSGTLGLVSSMVGFAACPIFLICPLVYPPLAPLGFVCAALGSGGAVTKFGLDWITEIRFNRATRVFLDKVRAYEGPVCHPDHT